MTKHICYIADDGTTFEDENECINYERGLMLKNYEHDIHMWDCEFQPIPITDSKAFDKVDYLTCDTAEAVEVMHNCFKDIDYSSPFEGNESFAAMAGRQYYYYMDNDKWYEADDLIEKARGMMKIFGV